MAAELPDDGEVQLGAVRLPRGAGSSPRATGPVAWVTSSESEARGRPFPGLAPAVRERLSTAERTAALAGLPPARVCLVPAARRHRRHLR
jgi:hypothetical protein